MKRLRLFAPSQPNEEDQGNTSRATERSNNDGPRKVSFCFATAEKRSECLSREFNKMPMQARERVAQDVYGTVDKDTINVDMSPDTMDEFWSELEKVPEKQAYELAFELDPEAARDPFLAVAFLRSVDGSAKRAAKRYTSFWRQKLDLFGEDKLVRPITLDDFDEDDMESLNSGGFQVLRSDDRAGRPILFGRYTAMKYKHIKNMVSQHLRWLNGIPAASHAKNEICLYSISLLTLWNHLSLCLQLRVLWYCWMSMIEDEQHQKAGVIGLGYEVSRIPIQRFDGDPDSFDMSAADGGFDRDFARGCLRLPLGLPIRVVGYHICADAPQWQGITDMVMVTVCKLVRLRFRAHFGTHQECQYALMTHGIPVDSIPVTPEGDIELSNHMEWIAHRRALEAARRGDAGGEDMCM